MENSPWSVFGGIPSGTTSWILGRFSSGTSEEVLEEIFRRTEDEVLVDISDVILFEVSRGIVGKVFRRVH